MAEGVKSAQRALEILELMTRREEPMAFTEFVEALGYPRSSLHGLLQTLVASGWAEFDENTRRFSLGIRTLEAGNTYTRAVGLVDRAAPAMRRIRDAMNETVQLAVLDGRHNVYVAKFDGEQALALASEVGRRLPAHATGVGKVLLADLDHEELARRFEGVTLERYTNRTIADLTELRKALAQIRRRGYATDMEEYTAGVRCIAMPLRDHTGQTLAAMSISVPTIRFDRTLQSPALAMLREGAQKISAVLGYNPNRRDRVSEKTKLAPS
jgi:DNA-binding IclR family transcriptional regulator